MAVTTKPTACTGPFGGMRTGGTGVHALVEVVETLTNGLQRKRCGVCREVFLVEPDAVVIWADLIPESRLQAARQARVGEAVAS